VKKPGLALRQQEIKQLTFGYLTQILITRKSIYYIILKTMNNSPISADDKPRSGRVFDDQ